MLILLAAIECFYSIRVPSVFVVRMIVIKTDMPDEIAWVESNSMTTIAGFVYGFVLHWTVWKCQACGKERNHCRANKWNEIKNFCALKMEIISGLCFDCFSFFYAPNLGMFKYNEIVNDVTAPTIRRLIIPRKTCSQLNKSSIQFSCHLIDGWYIIKFTEIFGETLNLN